MGLLYTQVTGTVKIRGQKMARRVFFSFHYQRDVTRAAVVRNSWVTKQDREFAGFWDKAKWEKIKRGGDETIKQWINQQLRGTSVTVVLIGYETHKRKYVKYEIMRSLRLKHGLLGIYVHGLKNLLGKTSLKGPNPFYQFVFPSPKGGDIRLSDVMKTYDWVKDNGYENFGKWVEAAARQAGK